MKKLKIYIVLFSLCVSLISGCGTIRGGILYTIYPIGFVLDRIGGPYVTKETIQDDVMIQSASAKENLKELLEKYSVFFHVGTVEPYLTVHMDEIK
ncbi:MAG: hypothetical protein IJ875_07660, partial [Solobacterium sp.]|nr:hypothetical protein [Solobacterium sp.]